MFGRIAFIKLCCPGDILFTTPAVRAVKKQFPDSELYYITGNYSRFVPEHNPHIDRTIIVQPPFEMGGRFSGIRSMAQGISRISGRGIDLAVSFHRSRLVTAMARFAGVRNVLGFDTARPMADMSRQFNPDEHEVRRYLQLVSAMEAEADGIDMEYATTPDEDREAARLLQEHGIVGPFAAIAPGGGENPGTTMHIKRWPSYYYREVARYIRFNSSLSVVAVGSNSERNLAAAIGADINLAGNTTFQMLAAIMKMSRIVIGNDSGPLYLASAMGTPTVGIYGPSSPKLVGPLRQNHRSVLSAVWCQPCYHPQNVRRGLVKCPTGTWACMMTLRPEQVCAAIEDLLGHGRDQSKAMDDSK